MGDDLIEAMAEAVAYMDGKTKGLVTHEVLVPDDVDVAAIRKGLGLTRSAFCRRFGLDIRAVQEWEQKRRRPDRAARALMLVIKHNPQAVEAALHDAA
ncbi:putative DNA-binding protein [Rhodospirillum rubrum ATCC 11170]|uniref:DNA-binding protein n=2 Tax=Rhodospirillum rubrum TaxID=1085 RepID=Q2RQ57_RHORT|nr:putative DNA-binding protein [Rhodospirillum rubrum ATCC 11170]MBK5955414.1 transcriptional regulator [Rhodospirillum rubrum]HAQ00876.1 transcriptional regulator [Rhodospirillum rubrum]HCF16988.1 transcriptional regulator [Rhodospirillum rubrum]